MSGWLIRKSWLLKYRNHNYFDGIVDLKAKSLNLYPTPNYKYLIAGRDFF